MSGKIICPKCNGNGHIKHIVDQAIVMQEDCKYCNNQGEVDITEQVLAELEASGRRLV
jgi:DnaJ-class molecular chaperone